MRPFMTPNGAGKTGLSAGPDAAVATSGGNGFRPGFDLERVSDVKDAARAAFREDAGIALTDFLDMLGAVGGTDQ